MPEIGATLHDARNRRKVDLMQVETDTKIRTKYLRALENEEWDLLPGPTYVKTFLRTYAEYLGLDAKLLVEEYKQRYERPSAQELTPFSTNLGSRRERRRARGPLISPGVIAGICFVALIGLLAGIGLLWDDSSDDPAAQRPAATRTPTASVLAARERRARERRARERRARERRRRAAANRTVRLQIVPEAVVNVCLVSRTGTTLIRSQNLSPGNPSRRFTGRRFRVTFGNGQVRMRIDGRSYAVPDTDAAIGYDIRPGRSPRRIPAASQPTCT
jgi:cytoskeleton protein RodZ